MPLSQKPEWLKVKAPGGENFSSIKEVLRKFNLNTVCEEASCPNLGECWGGGTATFMLMGETCTRGCRFCDVDSGHPEEEIDRFEPMKIARAVSEIELEYVVLTSVDRDDLPDGGADHFATTVEMIRELDPSIYVETLIPDFQGNHDHMDRMCSSEPDVLAHNLETIERLTPEVRDPRAGYEQSLDVLEYAKERNPDQITKSSIMVGWDETRDELRQAMQDLRSVGCDILTFGQYLRPSSKHKEVDRFVPPEEFEELKEEGEEMGFSFVASGPLVRSSYRAGEFFVMNMLDKDEDGSTERTDQEAVQAG
jgi:lipoic acid synthetase